MPTRLLSALSFNFSFLSFFVFKNLKDREKWITGSRKSSAGRNHYASASLTAGRALRHPYQRRRLLQLDGSRIIINHISRKDLALLSAETMPWVRLR
jgi:hypothetical protein